ncbi:hypothetical protein [Bacteroides sp.]|nr:hypothetical protein [Bacteroides sp.]
MDRRILVAAVPHKPDYAKWEAKSHRNRFINFIKTTSFLTNNG